MGKANNKAPTKGGKKETNKQRERTQEVGARSTKTQIESQIIFRNSNNNLLIASSMLQPYYTQVGWFFIWVLKLRNFFPWIGLEDGAMQ